MLLRWLERFREWWHGRADIQAFFNSLPTVRVNRDGYTRTDRYRDFRNTFNNEHGRRVLSQIIEHCEGLPIVEKEVSDTHRTAFRAGQREPGLWIVRVLNAEPLEPQQRGNHD